ncbi:hypothetical protein L210DRAFT_3575710 [Boletus edulis BED1]|uniref:Uncharacterized protein n=1 Tax=Boletus edulis BED1 TaxID=1328754 RepID=A0AAD4G6T8_BOLED|nr:hypothetical protein L210DRAFT_3575710 [Boletus edulis BED1]
MTTRVQCIRSRARAQMQGDVGPPLFAISLASFFLDVLRIGLAQHLCQISGWEFDDLDILIRQRLCEALYPLGRTMELLWMKKSTRLYSSPIPHSTLKRVGKGNIGEYLLRVLVCLVGLTLLWPCVNVSKRSSA